jgi:phosphoglucosamine mutase
MGVYFGTDGIRGVYGGELTSQLAERCGYAMTMLKPNAKIIIGRDTRVSGQILSTSLALGAIIGGAEVTDADICSTPCISYLTKKYGYDYGVVISASHNPPQYNGIKVFDNTGKKLSDRDEMLLEKRLANIIALMPKKIGKIENGKHLVADYIDYIISCGGSLAGLKIALDCAYGATYISAKKVFTALGAKVVVSACANNGAKINENVGATHPENIARIVQKTGADFGFSFDGDGDRVMAVDKNGKIYNGDNILLALANYYAERGELSKKVVVGTSMTNLGLENALKAKGIGLERADVGDKYVIDKIGKLGALLGGEQSGHVIISNLMPTGDGVLVATIISSIIASSGKTFEELLGFDTYPQLIVNVETKDKLRIMGSEVLANAINYINQELGETGRVLVRPSGTEDKIRIMVECTDLDKAQQSADYLVKIIEKIKEDYICAE